MQKRKRTDLTNYKNKQKENTKIIDEVNATTKAIEDEKQQFSWKNEGY